jgi:hypothetical protein
VESIDLKYTGLLNELIRVGVIDDRDMDLLMSEKTCYGRNEQLLSLLNRKSFEMFQKFLSALDINGQRHIADFIRSKMSEYNY